MRQSPHYSLLPHKHTHQVERRISSSGLPTFPQRQEDIVYRHSIDTINASVKKNRFSVGRKRKCLLVCPLFAFPTSNSVFCCLATFRSFGCAICPFVVTLLRPSHSPQLPQSSGAPSAVEHRCSLGFKPVPLASSLPSAAYLSVPI